MNRNLFYYLGVMLLALTSLTGCSQESDSGSGTALVLFRINNILSQELRASGETLSITFNGIHIEGSPFRVLSLSGTIRARIEAGIDQFLAMELRNLRGDRIVREVTTVRLSRGALLTIDESLVGIETRSSIAETLVASDARTEVCTEVADSLSPVFGLRICIPPNMLEQDTTLIIEEVYNPMNAPGLNQAGVAVDVRFDPDILITSPVSMEYRYDPDRVSVLGIEEGDLALFRLDRLAAQWAILPGQELQPEDDRIAVDLTSLGLFVVGGPLPNPGGNVPPVADDKTVMTLQNTPVRITLTGSDADGDAFNFSSIGQPANGTLIFLNSNIPIYIPDENFVGRDDFAYVANDGELDSIAGTVTIIVETVNPSVGDSPISVAVADLNLDDIPDLVTANAGDNSVSVLLGHGDGTFDDERRRGVGNGLIIDVAVEDLNRDGVPDLVTANAVDNSVSVLLGRGDGTFDDEFRFNVDNNPRDVTIEDLDRNGILDLVTANFSSDNVSVQFGNGDGTFSGLVIHITVGLGPNSVAVGDLDGDEFPDLVTSNYTSNTVSVLLRRGDRMSNFEFHRGDWDMGERPRAVAIKDLNGDGVPDLVTANADSDNVSVRLGRGDGTFDEEARFDVGDNPRDVAIEDLNRDGVPDLVTANANSRNVSVLIGHGDGTFANVFHMVVGRQPASVAVEDLNLDGSPDLVTTHLENNNVLVLIGRGDGTFNTEFYLDADENPSSVAVGDLNGDNTQDLVITNAGSENVSVLLGHDNGTFADELLNEIDGSPHAVALGDLDKNGALDLVTANGGSGSVSVLLGRGDGTFQDEFITSTRGSTRAMALGHLDNDDILDLVTGDFLSDLIELRRGLGDGTFDGFPFRTIRVGEGPIFVVVEDLNDDDVPDIIAANAGSHNVSILLGRGNGIFSRAVPYRVGLDPRAVAVGDLNKDTIPDLVTANVRTDDVSILLGNGDGTFQDAFSILVGDNPNALALGHLNDDDALDLVVANDLSRDVSILLGRGDGMFANVFHMRVGNNPRTVALEDLNYDNVVDLVTANSGSNNISIRFGRGDGTF